MNYKYIKHLLSSLSIMLIACMFYSCDDYLSKNPDNRLELDSEIKIKKVLVSAYPQSSYYLLTEMASDNTDENASPAYSPISLGQEQSYRWQDVIGSDIDTPYDIWSKHYLAIQTACAAIDALQALRDEGKVSDEDLAKGIDAEARLCRAYGHFVLVNLFSKTYDKETSKTDLGIPYVEEAEKNLIVTYDRGTVQGVYEKIEKDIVEALKNVNYITTDAANSQNKGVKKYHWNKQAAYAFAARFYLYYQKYQEAIDCATVALGDNPASVLRNWAADGVYAFKREIAYNTFISADQSANFLLVPAESLWGRVSGPQIVGMGFAMQGITVKEIAPDAALPIGGALRYSYAVYDGSTIVSTHKIGEYFEYYDKVAGIGWTHIVQPLFTADETLLARAEAYALLGDQTLKEATADLDTFLKAYTYYYNKNNHTKSPEDLIAFMKSQPFYEPTASGDIAMKKKINLKDISENQENVLYGILLARRSLTAHEGLRWFDINRYKIEIYRRKIYEGSPIITDKLTVDDPRRVFQIPQQMVVAGVEPNQR